MKYTPQERRSFHSEPHTWEERSFHREPNAASRDLKLNLMLQKKDISRWTIHLLRRGWFAANLMHQKRGHFIIKKQQTFHRELHALRREVESQQTTHLKKWGLHSKHYILGERCLHNLHLTSRWEDISQWNTHLKKGGGFTVNLSLKKGSFFSKPRNVVSQQT